MVVKNKGDYKDVEEQNEKEAIATKCQLPTKRCRRCGISLQVILFVLNGAAWVISIIAITGGLIIGFGTQTIDINFEIDDLLVLTPATLFITYGFALLIVTGMGCFASASANIFHNICYIALLVSFIVFDLALGFWMLISPNSLIDIIKHLRKSMDGYGKIGGSSVGIFRLAPTVYWDHLQRRGRCCGLEKYLDWKNATIGKVDKGLPDSCCNEEYNHRYCGGKILQHPNMKGHSVQDMVHTKGCLTIFPPTLTTAFEEITYMGLLLGALLISCLILTIVIIFLISTRKYDPGQGIANYQLVEVARNVSALDIAEYSEERISKKRYILEGRRQSKVHPLNENADAGDYKGKSKRKVYFKESGPQLIPSQHFVDSDDEFEFPVAPSMGSPVNDYKSKVVRSKKK